MASMKLAIEFNTAENIRHFQQFSSLVKDQLGWPALKFFHINGLFLHYFL